MLCVSMLSFILHLFLPSRGPHWHPQPSPLSALRGDPPERGMHLQQGNMLHRSSELVRLSIHMHATGHPFCTIYARTHTVTNYNHLCIYATKPAANHHFTMHKVPRDLIKLMSLFTNSRCCADACVQLALRSIRLSTCCRSFQQRGQAGKYGHQA